jgi:hypothetical protein
VGAVVRRLQVQVGLMEGKELALIIARPLLAGKSVELSGRVSAWTSQDSSSFGALGGALLTCHPDHE